MIVDHAGGLHKSVASRRPHEFKATLFQRLAQQHRLLGAGLYRGHGFMLILERSEINKRPKKIGQRFARFFHLNDELRIGHHSLDFLPMANDSGVRD